MVTQGPRKPLHDPCGGVLCLDFVNTVSREDEHTGRDRLRGYSDLLTWCTQAGILSPAEGAALARLAAERAAEAESVLERARTLREASFRIFFGLTLGRTPGGDDLALVNAELGRALAHVRVQPEGDGFVLGWEQELAGDERLAAPVWKLARSAAELMTSENAQRVKECAAEHCLWLFLDKSKNRKRRWCEMKTCGNRAKVRRHRKKQRASD